MAWFGARAVIYIKSALVGLFTFFVATVVYVVSLIFILMRNPVPPGVEVGFNLGSFVYRPSFWLIALVAFALGFYLEFRRA
jgi:uncharacterized membrane protein YtjA (UPF0391 family)